MQAIGKIPTHHTTLSNLIISNKTQTIPIFNATDVENLDIHKETATSIFTTPRDLHQYTKNNLTKTIQKTPKRTGNQESQSRIGTLSSETMPNINKESLKINLYCSIAKPNSLTSFLIDTGAQLSIIKDASIRRTIKILLKLTIHITGITKTNIDTITKGMCEADIHIDDSIIRHPFHIVEADTIDLVEDGILGTDFLMKCQATITFHKDKIQISTNFNKLETNTNHTRNTTQHLQQKI